MAACVLLAQGYDFSDPSFSKFINPYWLWDDLLIDPNPPLTLTHTDALLTEDYIDYLGSESSSLNNHRTKRELPGCHSNERELPSLRCCKEAIEKPGVFDKIKEVKRECFSTIKANRSEVFEFDMFSCERLEKKKAELRCGFQCIVKKQNLVSGQESLLDYVETQPPTYFSLETMESLTSWPPWSISRLS